VEIRSLPTHEGLDTIRGFLAVLLTFDFNHDIDRTCTEKLGISRPQHGVTIGDAG
jgi:hypothetical protein